MIAVTPRATPLGWRAPLIAGAMRFGSETILRLCLAVCAASVGCGDDDGATPSDAGPEPDRAETPVPPPPRMDAMPEASVDAGAPDATRPTRPDLGPIEDWPGPGLPPCDPRDPAACPDGESCRAVYASEGFQFTCRFGGRVAAGDPCTFAPSGASGMIFTDDCLGGLFCTDFAEGQGRRCAAICASNDECGAGERCHHLFRAVPPFDVVGTCRRTADCDVTSGGGCPAGLSCVPYPDVDLRFGDAYCEPTGPLGEGETCFGSESCGAGLACSVVPLAEGGFDPSAPNVTPARCQQLCDATAVADSCGAASSGCVRAASPHTDPAFAAGFCRLPHAEPIGPDDRPARIVVPASYDGTAELPLVVVLHGQTGTGEGTDALLRVTRQANRDDFLALVPNGRLNADRVRYWNVFPVACTEEPCPDDVAYILDLIAATKSRYRVNADRVYVTGISNGGYMAYRLACEGADVITAIASQAGSDVLDASSCTPARPVSVLEIHGDADINVSYVSSARSAGAIESVERWAAIAGCDTSMPSMGTPFDVDTMLAGDETTVRSYTTGCMPGLDAELWTIVGADHFYFSRIADDYFDRVMTWLLRHSR